MTGYSSGQEILDRVGEGDAESFCGVTVPCDAIQLGSQNRCQRGKREQCTVAWRIRDSTIALERCDQQAPKSFGTTFLRKLLVLPSMKRHTECLQVQRLIVRINR